MSDVSPLLSLPYLLPSQAQKHVTHNEALRLLDVIVQLAVTDRDRTAPPPAPAEGDRHIVAAPATGDWAGQEDRIALRADGQWRFVTPGAGWQARILSEDATAVFDGTAWRSPAEGPGAFARLGVNATADAVNRLAVGAEGSLFSHAGAGHRMTVNKAAPADTASLLFQTGWSGRAEIGTTGSDALSVKVSADGSSWTTALALNAATGLASGAAVQQTATDATAGRLARADWAFHRGTVLGAVAMSAGLPTGALIERGSNANGHYVRFACGTQICWALRTSAQQWNFPASFVGTASDRVVFVTAAANICRTATAGDNSLNRTTPRLYDHAGVEVTGSCYAVVLGFWA